ncbi:MAG: hypothetical protein Q9170_006164 [Blastenia crenularia]
MVRRKIILLLQIASVLFLLVVFIATFRHLRQNYTLDPTGAVLPAQEPISDTTTQHTGSKPPVPSSKSPGKDLPKKVNDTLVKAASPYLKAIVDPEDKAFPRLECPSPSGNRYHHLLDEGNNTTDHAPRTALKYFFALDLHQCRELLPRLLGSTVETIRYLGPQRCALSIVEGRSDDGTYEVLTSLRQEVEGLGAKYFLQTNEINPKAEGADRVEALSQLRNQALQPLIDLGVGQEAAATVIFLNDVAICMEDILELIHQRRYQDADMMCAMDWTYVGPDPTFYDVWIARGMTGDSFFNIPPDGNWNSAWNLFWNDPESKQKLDAGQPFQVFSCWNGAVTFTAKPILEQQVKFHRAHKNECGQGEPKSFCKDLWTLGYGKIAVVPSVNLEYSDENAKRIKSLKGYVSNSVDNGAGNDKIEWRKSPPAKVKCMAGYENQHWRPWDEKALNNTIA